MFRKKIYKFSGIIFCLLFCILLQTDDLNAKDKDTEISELVITDGDQDYGTLYGAPYSESDTSKWLTLSLEGRGFRIVNNEGNDIVLIDQFGSVYINGILCNPVQDEDNSIAANRFSYGFIYFLVIVSLALNGYNFINRKGK